MRREGRKRLSPAFTPTVNPPTLDPVFSGVCHLRADPHADGFVRDKSHAYPASNPSPICAKPLPGNLRGTAERDRLQPEMDVP